jgi:3-oxoacyl-[acyl-carrier-protein] synthase II
MASGHVSMRHGLKGPVHSVATACAAGSHSIGDAYNFIRLGYADLMLAGGTEANIDPLGVAGFARMKALSLESDPLLASRPFDSKRNGFVIGEGAAILVLEELETALKRNAPIIAEICGYGLSGDAYHPTSPSLDGEGAARCMHTALRDANIDPNLVGYINAHATSTPAGDAAEVSAIQSVFSDVVSGAKSSRNVPLYVSSTKGATGHLLGAAGAMEAAFTAFALQTGVLPPTLNLENIESNVCGGETFQHVPKKSLIYSEQNNDKYGSGHVLQYAVNNSFGFGGTNASLVLKKWVA